MNYLPPFTQSGSQLGGRLVDHLHDNTMPHDATTPGAAKSLTHTQFRVMAVLKDSQGDGEYIDMPAKEIARLAEMNYTSVNRAISALVHQGLITRSSHGGNRGMNRYSVIRR